MGQLKIFADFYCINSEAFKNFVETLIPFFVKAWNLKEALILKANQVLAVNAKGINFYPYSLLSLMILLFLTNSFPDFHKDVLKLFFATLGNFVMPWNTMNATDIFQGIQNCRDEILELNLFFFRVGYVWAAYRHLNINVTITDIWKFWLHAIYFVRNFWNLKEMIKSKADEKGDKAVYKTTRSSHQMCSLKNVFLKISQNSQENNCDKDCFLIKLQATLAQVFSYEFCEIFKNTFFTEQLWTTAFKLLIIIRIDVQSYKHRHIFFPTE